MEFNEITNQIKDFSNSKLEFKTLFFSNAIAGEVGEYCNLVKKFYRDIKYNSETIAHNQYLKLRSNIRKELADIFIYLVLNAKNWSINLEFAILDKIKEVNKRSVKKE